MSYQIFHADCFSWLRDQPGNAIHGVLTDPPYGLSFIGDCLEMGTSATTTSANGSTPLFQTYPLFAPAG